MRRLETLAEIQGLLDRYGRFEECFLTWAGLSDDASSFELAFNVVRDDSGSVRKRTLEEPRVVALRLTPTIETFVHNNLHTEIRTDLEQTNWGLSEVAVVRVEEVPGQPDTSKRFRLTVSWESDRSVEILFGSVLVLAEPEMSSAADSDSERRNIATVVGPIDVTLSTLQDALDKLGHIESAQDEGFVLSASAQSRVRVRPQAQDEVPDLVAAWGSHEGRSDAAVYALEFSDLELVKRSLLIVAVRWPVLIGLEHGEWMSGADLVRTFDRPGLKAPARQGSVLAVRTISTLADMQRLLDRHDRFEGSLLTNAELSHNASSFDLSFVPSEGSSTDGDGSDPSAPIHVRLAPAIEVAYRNPRSAGVGDAVGVADPERTSVVAVRIEEREDPGAILEGFRMVVGLVGDRSLEIVFGAVQVLAEPNLGTGGA